MADEVRDDAKKEDKEQEEQKSYAIPEPDFITFIFTLSTHAQIGMGLIPNPISKKVEVDLNLAKYQIDVIGMLKEKTKGNLDENEGKFIENILHELRMVYVNVAKESKKSEQK